MNYFVKIASKIPKPAHPVRVANTVTVLSDIPVDIYDSFQNIYPTLTTGIPLDDYSIRQIYGPRLDDEG